jgi:hypothetical protein
MNDLTENPYQSTEQIPAPQATLTGGGWAQFMGILQIMGGAFLCLTCFGAIFGVPYLLSGIEAYKGGEKANRIPLNSDPALIEVTQHFIRHFKITGIVTVVFVGLYVAAIVAIMAAGLMAPLIQELNKSP